MIATPHAKTASPPSSTGTSSHDHRTPTPAASMNTSTGTRLSTRLNDAVNTTDSGTAARGNSILRTSGSRATIEVTDVLVDSLKNVNSTTPSSIALGKYGTTPCPTTML